MELSKPFLRRLLSVQVPPHAHTSISMFLSYSSGAMSTCGPTITFDLLSKKRHFRGGLFAHRLADIAVVNPSKKQTTNITNVPAWWWFLRLHKHRTWTRARHPSPGWDRSMDTTRCVSNCPSGARTPNDDEPILGLHVCRGTQVRHQPRRTATTQSTVSKGHLARKRPHFGHARPLCSRPRGLDNCACIGSSRTPSQ